jgi:hypothetical protein
VTRVVIGLSQDISGLIPILAKQIGGYGYDFHGPTVGFRFEDHSAIIERDKVTIYGVYDEIIAERMMAWIRDKVTRLEDADVED